MNRTSDKSHGSTNTSTDNRALDRSDSSVTKLCDLHVYKVPPELWRDNLNNVLNNAVTETVSVGIIRVPEELRLAELRAEVSQQLTSHGLDLVPTDYVFLRSVGRSLTTLRGKQEQQLKARHFLPPVAYAPELYILEVTPEVRDALAASDASFSSLSQTGSPSHTRLAHSPHTGYRGECSSLNLHMPHQPGLLARSGYKPMPRVTRSMDASTRLFSENTLAQSLPNNHNLGNRNSYWATTDSENHGQQWNDVSQNHGQQWNDVSQNHGRQWNDVSHDGFQSAWPGQTAYTKLTNTTHRQLSHPQATQMPHRQLPHTQATQMPHRQLPHLQATQMPHRQLPHTQATHTPHRHLPHTQTLDVSTDERHGRWSAENGGDSSPDGSQTAGVYGRRGRAQDGGISRRARDKHADRLNSENDSEDEPGVQKGHGVRANSRRPHRRSDNDEQGLSSDEETSTRDRQQKLGHENLLKNVEQARTSRLDQEKERAELVRKAKQIQQKIAQYRNEARDIWKKKYFEEKKRTAPLEDTSNVFQNELEALRRKQMNILEAPRDKSLRLSDGGPSEKSNHVIQCARLRHEIEDLARRLEMTRLKLTSEMKLRAQAQAEMKAVRSEAMQNRLVLRGPKAGHRNTTVMAAAK